MLRYLRRYVQVLYHFIPIASVYLRDRKRFVVFGPARRVDDATHRNRAERIAKTMLELGPAFVKVGQVLSTRPDIVTPIYADVFESLQDQVPENVGGDPSTVVRTELSEVIDLSTLAPVAGGSLAFVYVAEFEEERIALKVRRPGVVAMVERDLDVINGLIPFISVFVGERKQYSIENVANDFREIIRNELDFKRERRMMGEIKEHLSDEPVRVPTPYESISSERIIAMEFVEGMKITDPKALDHAGLDAHHVATRIANTYLRMGLIEGVFHADPHPGNLALADDGMLVIYDYGMSQRLTPQEQADITSLYRTLVHRDVDGLLHTLIALDVLDPSVDRVVARRVLNLVIENLEGQSDITWHRIITELFANLRHLPVRIPPNVFLLIRVGTVGEGVCRSLDPDFDFVAVARSFLVEHGFVESELQALASEMRDDIRQAIPVLAKAPSRFDRVFAQLERGELVIRSDPVDRTPPPEPALPTAILGGSLIIATAILTLHERPYEVVSLLAVILVLARYMVVIRT